MYIGQDFQTPHTPDNESLLHACLGKRLNPAIPNKTINNSNTQKVGSFNRTLQQSLPRNVTFLVWRIMLLTPRATVLATRYTVCVPGSVQPSSLVAK